MSKDFSKNIGPQKVSKKRKPTDAQIEKALTGKKVSKPEAKPDQTTFNIRMPEAMYEELKRTANRSGVSMSSIIKQGITAELKRLNG